MLPSQYHMPVDVQRSDCDFLAFSAHKMLGPTGVGILYAKREILEGMPPFISGGDMIKEVHKQATIYNDLPYRFEGGTSNIAGVIGFGAALDYLSRIGMDRVTRSRNRHNQIYNGCTSGYKRCQGLWSSRCN